LREQGVSCTGYHFCSHWLLSDPITKLSKLLYPVLTVHLPNFVDARVCFRFLRSGCCSCIARFDEISLSRQEVDRRNSTWPITWHIPDACRCLCPTYTADWAVSAAQCWWMQQNWLPVSVCIYQNSPYDSAHSAFVPTTSVFVFSAYYFQFSRLPVYCMLSLDSVYFKLTWCTYRSLATAKYSVF